MGTMGHLSFVHEDKCCLARQSLVNLYLCCVGRTLRQRANVSLISRVDGGGGKKEACQVEGCPQNACPS